MEAPRYGRLVILLIAAAAIGGIVFLTSGHKPATPSRAVTLHPATKPTTQSDCLKTYHDQVLCQFATAQTDSKLAYSSTETLTDAQGQSKTESVQRDSQGDVSITTTNNGKVSSLIQIGKTLYVKQPGSDTWIRTHSSTGTGATPGFKTNFSSSTTPVSQKIIYKSLGTEACGQLTCYKYQVTRNGAPGTMTLVWFDTQKLQVQHKRTDSKNGSDDIVITYGDVAVTAPALYTDPTQSP